MLACGARSGQQGSVSALYTYRHSGLVIASQLELPEWEAFACESGKPDVRIVLSDEPSPECSSDRSVVEGDVLRFAIEGIGGWQIEGGHTITLHPGPTTAPPELRLFTLGSAWGALGYQRGFAMWHGSAVERDGRAVMFCGDAGAGKSTMAAALCAQGAALVGDDLNRVEWSEAAAVVHPSSSRIKLWREAIEHLGWQDQIIQRDYFRDDKFHCGIASNHAGGGPVPLSAVVVLEEGETTSLERCSGSEALELVMGGTLYRPEMIDALGQWGIQGALAAQVISKVPVLRFTRAKRFDSLAVIASKLTELWEV